MPDVIYKTGPNKDGEMLWCVHYKSSYRDSDPRWPSTVPVDSRSYVLARSRDEAIEKAMPGIKKARQTSDKGAGEEIVANIVTLEDLVVARNSKEDGRLGWLAADKLAVVALSNAEDTKRYRLAVCLVPVEE